MKKIIFQNIFVVLYTITHHFFLCLFQVFPCIFSWVWTPCIHPESWDSRTVFNAIHCFNRRKYQIEKKRRKCSLSGMFLPSESWDSRTVFNVMHFSTQQNIRLKEKEEENISWRRSQVRIYFYIPAIKDRRIMRRSSPF